MRQRLLTLPSGRRARWAVMAVWLIAIDTFIVRSVIGPAITLDLGRRTWIPSSLSRGEAEGTEGTPPLARRAAAAVATRNPA